MKMPVRSSVQFGAHSIVHSSGYLQLKYSRVFQSLYLMLLIKIRVELLLSCAEKTMALSNFNRLRFRRLNYRT